MSCVCVCEVGQQNMFIERLIMHSRDEWEVKAKGTILSKASLNPELEHKNTHIASNNMMANDCNDGQGETCRVREKH